jgi:hypothetical protein
VVAPAVAGAAVNDREALEAILELCDEADHGQQSLGSMYAKVTTHELRVVLKKAGVQPVYHCGHRAYPSSLNGPEEFCENEVDHEGDLCSAHEEPDDGMEYDLWKERDL